MVDEKELDYQVNRLFVGFRKFEDEKTCPFCKLKTTALKPMVESVLLEDQDGHLIKKKHKHEQETCFRRYYALIHALDKDENGNYIPEQKLFDTIDNAFNHLKSMQRKFTEGKN